jgi:hypothetical protein
MWAPVDVPKKRISSLYSLPKKPNIDSIVYKCSPIFLKF